MDPRRSFDYFVAKYVPNAAGAARVNIGVILVETRMRRTDELSSAFSFASARFLNDLSVLKPLAGKVDLELISAIVSKVNSTCDAAAASRAGGSALAELLRELGSASNGVILEPPVFLTAADPQLALDELATKWLRGKLG